MTDTMFHRGPDAGEVWSKGSIGLGHRRLSIIDLAGGRQPVHSELTGAVGVYNGEIYNYRELRRELQSRGHVFRSNGDAEVLLRAYEAYGEQCVERLRGMFAFAIWDPGRKLLFAARDRFGIKPFYFHFDGATLRFASELKALLSLPEVPRNLDEAAVSQYLLTQYVPGPGTIFRGIRKLMPGGWLRCDASGLSEGRYWALEVGRGQGLSRKDTIRGVLERLDDAVSSHMVSDVPVGALLSGGIDSSVLVGIMQRHADQPVQTFSVGFTDPRVSNELGFARQVADRFGTVHRELMIDSSDALQTLPKVVAQMDEPLADYAALPTYLVSKLASESVKVVLGGEGADEIFGGYPRYLKAWILAQWRLWANVGAAAWRRSLARLQRRGRSQGLPEAASLDRCRAAISRYRPTHLFSERQREALVGSSPCVPSLDLGQCEALWLQTHDGTTDSGDILNEIMSVDFRTWLPDNLLTKVDRMSMLASVEARVPYLDHHLVSYVMSVAGAKKIDLWRLRTKSMMKSAVSGLLPQSIIHRRKHGFTPPIDSWLRNGLRSVAHEVLLDGETRSRSIFDASEVLKLLKQHDAGQPNGHKIWSLLVFESWRRAHGVA